MVVTMIFAPATSGDEIDCAWRVCKRSRTAATGLLAKAGEYQIEMMMKRLIGGDDERRGAGVASCN